MLKMVLCSNYVPGVFPEKNSKDIPPDESTAKGKTPYKDSLKWSEQIKSSDCLEQFMYISTIKKQRTYQDIGDKDESGNLITILPGNFIHVLKKNIEVYLKFHPPAVRMRFGQHNLHHEHALLLDDFKHLVCRNTYTSIALEWNLMSEGIDSDVFCKEELLLLSKWLDIECLTSGSYKLDLIVQMPLMLRNSTSVFICKLLERKYNTRNPGNKNMACCKGKKEEFEESTHYNNFGKTNDDHAYTDNCLDKTNADADMQNERCDIEEISEFDGDDSQIKLKSEYLDYLDDKDCYIGASCPCLACQFTFVDCYLSKDVPDLTLTEFDEKDTELDEISDEKDTELDEISDDEYTELDDIYSVCSTEEIPSLIAKRKEKKLCDCIIHRNRDICSCLNEKIIWNRLEGELSSTPLYQDYNESDMERMPDEFMYDQIKAQKAESEISDFDKEDNEFASVNNDIGINEDSLSIETQPTFTSSYINRNIENVECECVHHRIESSENIKFVSPRTDINEHVGGRKNTTGDSGFFSLLENELPSEEEDLLLQKEKQEGNGKRNSQASDIESDDPGFNVGNRRYDLENHEDNRNDARDLLDGPTKNEINSDPPTSKSVLEKDDEPDGLVSIEESNVPSSPSANMLGMAVGGHDGQGSTGATSSTVNTSISAAYQLRLEAQNNPTFSANSLGSYFRECVAGKEFTFEQNTCQFLTLANEGFIYLGTEDRVKCFSCGMEYYGFKRWDNPREIHRQRSPDCRMVRGIESTNIPVRAQDQHRPALTNGIGVSHRNALENVVVQNNVATSQNGLVQPSAVQNALNNTADSRMEYHSRQPNTTLQQSIVSTDQASLSTTGHNNSQRPADVLERPARQPIGGGDRAEELGITIERPKYPAYAQLSVRISTFQGWPGYLDQAPRDMALAGFFYAGYNDYCRCFFCGGGLRNWDAGDDPWVEHARWFSKCAFVRQNRGHRFVEIIVKRQAEMQASGNASGSAKNQTAVTTNMPETETQAPTPATFESLPGKEKIEATELLEVVFSIDDNELGSNTAVNSENTQLVTGSQSRQQNLQMSTSSVERQTNQRIIQAQPANPPESSIPSLPSLSVSSLENKTTEAGAQEGALAATAHSKVSDAEIRSLQEENTQLKEQVMCKICMDKNVSIAFLPCGHLACCIDCAPAMRKCPMCRVYIKGTVKTYLA
ncbi:BIRC2_3 [Mytilus edulis]|uniref:BIRC2_3 n=1 Tax=Mytilus edulis TaxID=6550 RepID=A0A8S3UV28_MYTED|nr:BIRC2_3 [Mytilus edulis]